MGVIVPAGPRTWSVGVDRDGVRTYRVTWRVQVDSALVGPNEVRLAPGLPRPGDIWAFEELIDPWAWCTFEREVTPVQKREGSPVEYYDVTINFSTKAPKKCQDQKFEDPVLEFPTISGGSVRYTEEATIDRFLRPITNSSWELVKGKPVEFDANRPTVKVKMNVIDFSTVRLAYSMQDHLNSVELWGLPPRRIKLSGVDFERKFYGLCYAYYELSLEFDIGNAQHGGRPSSSTFDHDVADEGTMVLFGHIDSITHNYTVDNINGAPASPSNPRHFVRYKDIQAENTKTLLDGEGKPWTPTNALVAQACSDCTRVLSTYQTAGFARKYPEMEVTLTKVGGQCKWTYVGSYFTETFQWDATRTIWVYTNTFFSDQEWVLDINEPVGADFNCEGVVNLEARAIPNTPPNPAGSPDPPFSIKLFPGGTPPGRIHIEKYDEANFALLGIPLVF
jgi:hypothetical protein